MVDSANDREDQPYELDVEETSPEALQEALEDAVAAVDRQSGEAAGSTGAEASRITELEAEVATLEDRHRRTLADFQNFRKRTERERESVRRDAAAGVLQDLLAVVDNFERALAAPGGADDLKRGLEMIVRQQHDVFERHGVTVIDAVGEAFDPTLHEAVGRQESDDVDVPTVASEMQRGYLLNGRLLRPAMVTVAMPTSRPAPAAEQPDEDAVTSGSA